MVQSYFSRQVSHHESKTSINIFPLLDVFLRLSGTGAKFDKVMEWAVPVAGILVVGIVNGAGSSMWG